MPDAAQLDYPGPGGESESEESDTDNDVAVVGESRRLNDIKITYHRADGRESKVLPLQDYLDLEYYGSEEEQHDEETPTPDPVNEFEPWHPFPTRLDFELAEVILDSHMNRRQTEKVISIVRELMPNPDDSDLFTIKNTADLFKMWDLASRTRDIKVSLILLRNRPRFRRKDDNMHLLSTY